MRYINSKHGGHDEHGDDFDHGRLRNMLPNKTSDVPSSRLSGHGYRWTQKHFEAGKGKIQRVPLHKISSQHSHVSGSVVHAKITKRWGANDPRIPQFVHDHERDVYHLVDGNHQVHKRKIMGHKHVYGQVISKDDMHKHVNAAEARRRGISRKLAKTVSQIFGRTNAFKGPETLTRGFDESQIIPFGLFAELIEDK
jgi:hypothetical protein